MADAGISEAGEWVYRALAQGVIRSGPSLDSERTGKLAEGETITVSERQGVRGTMRVRFEKGWASVASKKGTPLLELTLAPGRSADAHDPEASESEPEARPEPEAPAALRASPRIGSLPGAQPGHKPSVEWPGAAESSTENPTTGKAADKTTALSEGMSVVIGISGWLGGDRKLKTPDSVQRHWRWLGHAMEGAELHAVCSQSFPSSLLF